MEELKEEWRPVVGWAHYEVSDQGRVRSLDRMVPAGPGRMRLAKGCLRKLQPSSPRPYPMVTLGRATKVYVHHLVLEAFVGPRPLGAECLHENDDPTDCRLVNLRWGTRSENKLDAVRNGIHHNARRTRCKRDHEFTPENTYVKKDGGRQCRQCVQDARGVKNPRGPRKARTL